MAREGGGNVRQYAEQARPTPRFAQQPVQHPLRQRGSEVVIIDEGSTNGTALDLVLLSPQSPRVLRSSDLVRVGRVWLEIRIDPLLIANATPTSAKALALGLITRALAKEGEDGSPRILVIAGPDAGKSLDVHDVTRRYVVGRAPDVDLVLLVFLFAAAVLVLSIVGFWWLLRN